jgi:clorobiocin biosynthesis protein CloN7
MTDAERGTGAAGWAAAAAPLSTSAGQLPAKDSPTVHTLAVPGARLHYEIRGSGPLAVLTGIPMGAAGFAPLASLLAEHYTVVSYDPRGMFRSPVDEPEPEPTPAVLADDLHRLLTALDDGPARVFGNSGGAVVGLELVARHPGQVITLVVHEPALPTVLPDRDQIRASIDDVLNTYVAEGRGAAAKSFGAATGIESFSPSSAARGAVAFFAPPAEVRAILDRFFGRLLRPSADYEPDTAALRAGSTRIVVAGGSTTDGQLAHRAAAALADRLGTAVVTFPGGHTGFQEKPVEFAQALHHAFTQRS